MFSISALSMLIFSGFGSIAPVHAQSYPIPITTQCLNEGDRATEEAFPQGLPLPSSSDWQEYTEVRAQAIYQCMIPDGTPYEIANPGVRTLPGNGFFTCLGAGCFFVPGNLSHPNKDDK